MPSASKLEKQTSTEAFDPMKQIVTIVEKKVRNLEKRKGKLDSYRQDSQNGKELNDDQKKAVEKYDLVVELLDFAKELQKQFQTVVQETGKAQKKAAKREQIERQQQELQRIKEIILYQDLLNNMGGEDVRQDFLEGNKGAIKLSEEELNALDELYKAISPERDLETEGSEFDVAVSTASEHIQALLDAKNKEAFGTTYKTLRETLHKISSCSYFTKVEDSPNETQSSLSEEKEEVKHLEPSDSNVDGFVMVPKTDDFVMVQQNEPSPSQVERPFYPVENPPMFQEQPQTHPIQEVLSGQGNLNFLQESQIEVESPAAGTQVPPNIPTPSYPGVPYPPMSAASMVRSQRPNEEAVPMAPGMVPPSAQPTDFDPGRPIPTQTYTNQSFHPMMGVPQNYVPPAMPHGLSPAHVMPAGMVPLPPRNAAVPPHNPQMGSEVSQPGQISPQYECNEMQESNVAKHTNSYGNGSGNHSAVVDSLSRQGTNAYPRNAGQVDFKNDRAYQSTNNSQAYMSRESFAENSSYSSNLKRGLHSRRTQGPSVQRGGNNTSGGRVGYRN